MNEIYIPLSFDCSPCIKLRKINIRTQAYPFDWNIKFFNSIFDLINNDFLDLFDENKLVFSEKSFFHNYDNNESNIVELIPVYNVKYNILFIHDFCKDKENKEIFDKYQNRIQRFIETISDSNNKIIFVYKDHKIKYKYKICKHWSNYFDYKIFQDNIDKPDKTIEELEELIKKKYGNNNISFIEENELNNR